MLKNLKKSVLPLIIFPLIIASEILKDKHKERIWNSIQYIYTKKNK